jgi:hypothetical protein
LGQLKVNFYIKGKNIVLISIFDAAGIVEGYGVLIFCLNKNKKLAILSATPLQQGFTNFSSGIICFTHEYVNDTISLTTLIIFCFCIR